MDTTNLIATAKLGGYGSPRDSACGVYGSTYVGVPSARLQVSNGGVCYSFTIEALKAIVTASWDMQTGIVTGDATEVVIKDGDGKDALGDTIAPSARPAYMMIQFDHPSDPNAYLNVSCSNTRIWQGELKSGEFVLAPVDFFDDSVNFQIMTAGGIITATYIGTVIV